MFFSDSASISEKASRYCRAKYALDIARTGYLVLLLVLFCSLGFSSELLKYLSGIIKNNLFLLPAYILAAYLLYYLLDFPLNFFEGFILEHRFGLSNQKAGDWLNDQLKSGAIFYILALLFASTFYYTLKHFLHSWWLVFSLFWISLSLVLAKLTPVLVIPLFFKYKKLKDEELRNRILALGEKMGVGLMDVFEIDFSKKTLKGNAAFAGLGRTRRVMLADTLKDKYNYMEIEVILAHEFAHYRLGHLWKLLLLDSLLTAVSFYILYLAGEKMLALLGFNSLWQISSLPAVLAYMVILGFIFRPLQNYISRHFERAADREALKAVGSAEAFISTFEKLSAQNLSDRNPPALIKFFFFNHPPIDERINMARGEAHGSR